MKNKLRPKTYRNDDPKVELCFLIRKQFLTDKIASPCLCMKTRLSDNPSLFFLKIINFSPLSSSKENKFKNDQFLIRKTIISLSFYFNLSLKQKIFNPIPIGLFLSDMILLRQWSEIHFFSPSYQGRGCRGGMIPAKMTSEPQDLQNYLQAPPSLPLFCLHVPHFGLRLLFLFFV